MYSPIRQNLHRLDDRFGLKPLDAHELSGLHYEVILTYNISLNWKEFGVLCSKTKKNTALMYEVRGK